MTTVAKRILVVDDDPLVAESLAECLAAHGLEVDCATDSREALKRLERSTHRPDDAAADSQPYSVAIIDMVMPGLSGLELIRTMHARNLGTVPIAITAYGSIESAVETVRLGAIDYLIKPVVDEELILAVERAHRQYVLISENSRLRRELHDRFALDGDTSLAPTRDPRMRRVFATVAAAAPTRSTVLMTGESGTGKSLIARAIHHSSPRADKPFVEISCGSIPETLLESELFGHVRGAFTGAHADKRGRFQAADGGTIFLDEINSASPGMQMKLLRVIQERRFEPVGSAQTVEVDVRIVLASNQPLERLVAAGEFRQDLYYRINVVAIDVPPLRDRVSDIPLLAERFLSTFAADAGREIIGFTDEAMGALRAYGYPGNVRELQNIVERAVVFTRSQRIQLNDLPEHVVSNQATQHGAESTWPTAPEEWQPMPLAEALREPERQIILAALIANNWNRARTAEALDINRSTLYKKMKQYGLDEYGQTG